MSAPAGPLPLLGGLIGWPVAQSKSPVIHHYWLDRLGIDGLYVRLAVPPGGAGRALRAVAALGFAGVQATMPHKRACFELVDRHTAAAAALGAVNTVTVEPDGSLTGDNTDLAGFTGAIADLDLGGAPVTVLGAGGAAAAVLAGAVSLGARDLCVINRSAESSARLLADLAETLASCRVRVLGWDQAQACADASALVVNASSLGMDGFPPLPLVAESLRADAVVYDIVTHPHRTALLRAAAARGLRCHDGLEMLIGQARAAFRRFYGAEPPGGTGAGGDSALRALLGG